MKKNMKEIRMLGLLTMAAAALLACSRLESPTPQMYTVTVEGARKGGVDPATKGTLTESEDGKTISTAWKTNDEVYVSTDNGANFNTTALKAKSAGATTTLSGTLKGTFTVNQPVYLQTLLPTANFNAFFENQEGTLDHIASSCDICYQTGKITAIEDAGDGKKALSITLDGNFKYSYAIVKFTLKKKSDSSDLKIKNLRMTIGGVNFETHSLSDETNVHYLAVPAMTDAKDITLTEMEEYYEAGEGTRYRDKSSCTVTDKKFEAGKFYRVTAYLQ